MAEEACFSATPHCTVHSSRSTHLYLQTKQCKLPLSSAIAAPAALMHVTYVSQFVISKCFDNNLKQKCQMFLISYLRHLRSLLPHCWLWKFILSCQYCSATWGLATLGLSNKSVSDFRTEPLIDQTRTSRKKKGCLVALRGFLISKYTPIEKIANFTGVVCLFSHLQKTNQYNAVTMSLTHHLQIILVTYCISLQNRLNLMFVTRKYLNSSASLWLQGVLTMSIRCECENSTESYLPLSLFLFSPLCHISSHDTEMCIELFVLRQYQGLQLRRGC